MNTVARVRLRAFACVFAFAACLSAQAAQDPAIAARLGELEHANPERARELVGELVALGDDAAAAALDATSEQFAAHALAPRRARSQIARSAGGAKALERALALLGDPDDVVRGNLIALLAAPEQRDTRVAERSAALEELARTDRSSEVRAAAVSALARIDQDASTAALERLLLTSESSERVAAARALCVQPRARQIVLSNVQRAFDAGATDARARVADDVLATLLEGDYGSALAEVPGGGETSRDRAPFVLGARSANPEVRDAARNALGHFVDRARALGDWKRAERVLVELLDSGLDDYDLLAQGAMLALEVGDEPRVALDAAREIRSRWPLDNDVQHREHHGHGALLEGVASIALGRAADASAALDVAARVFDSMRAERLDLRLDDSVAPQYAVVELRALVEVYRTLVLLAAGNAAGDAVVLERARTADEWLLEAQRCAAAQPTGRRLSLDDLILHNFGPLQLLFAGAHTEPLSRARALELERGLYSAFATVAGDVPGFEAEAGVAGRLAGRLTDPARKALLQQIAELKFTTVQAAIEQRLNELKKHPARGDDEEVRDLWNQLARLLALREMQRKEGDAALERLLEPALVGMSLCERLREEGATSAARKLAERIRDDLGRSHGALSDIELERAMARAETALGGALMDENSPGEADTVLSSALTRLEAIAAELVKQNNTQGGALIRTQTAGVLVSLAVNANVKMRRPEKAVEYFERAYALEQNDFMRVLLACYRARAGRTAEARAALRDVPVSPTNYYNLGCTWALLGERELALDFLKRDFDELRSSGGARERQKQWARSDPDLDSLRDDPRFQALVRPAEAAVK